MTRRFHVHEAGVAEVRERGHSFIEFTLASLLLIVILGSVFKVLIQGQDVAQNTQKQTVALLLARDMLEEIKGKEFEEPGTSGTFGREAGEGGRNRSAYDDVDDFDGYGQNSPPRDVDGAQLGEFSEFARSVTVENVDAGNFSRVRSAGSTPFKRILVRVSSTVAGEADIVLETISGRK